MDSETILQEVLSSMVLSSQAADAEYERILSELDYDNSIDCEISNHFTTLEELPRAEVYNDRKTKLTDSYDIDVCSKLH